MVVHIGFVVLSSLKALEYNSALVPISDAYFPNVRVEGRPPSNPVVPEHQGNVDLPDITIAEGGVKRRKPSSSSSDGINHAGVDRTAIDYE